MDLTTPRAVPAKLQRLNPKGPFQPVEYLCRNEVLFALTEWEWKSDATAAHVFSDYSLAEAAVKVHGGFPVVVQKAEHETASSPAANPKTKQRTPFTIAERVRQNRAGRRRRRIGRDPRAVFADLEKRNLA